MYGHAHAQHYSLERKLKTQDLKKFYVEMRPTDEQSPPFCLSVYLFLFLSGTSFWYSCLFRTGIPEHLVIFSFSFMIIWGHRFGYFHLTSCLSMLVAKVSLTQM